MSFEWIPVGKADLLMLVVSCFKRFGIALLRVCPVLSKANLLGSSLLKSSANLLESIKHDNSRRICGDDKKPNMSLQESMVLPSAAVFASSRDLM
jgi:hypothetical protein